LAGEREARVFIVNKEHQVVYQSGSGGNGVDAATHPGVNEALKGSSGTLYMQDRGIEHVVSYSDVQPLGWALVMEEPWQAVATPILTTTQIAPLVLVPLLLITLAGLWFGASQIVQPLRELEKRSARLAWGDFQSVNEEVGGIAEIRQLQAELAQMARKVQAAQSSLHEYIGEITEAQEDERLRLARELHDGTLQSLIALKQRVQMVQKSREETSDNQELNTLAALVEQTIEDVRRTTRALRPIYLEDLGLVTALEMLAQEAEESSGIKIAFSNHGNERRLPSSIELALYRMAQEALSNVARHSRASQAALNVQFEPNNLQLEIKDNGNGFQVPESPGELAPQGHFGLLGLYERAELIGANLVINSKVGEGTRLVIGLPIQQK
jgi:signal transduction histidine kinase